MRDFPYSWHFINPQNTHACLCGQELPLEAHVDHPRVCPLNLARFAKTVNFDEMSKTYWREVYKRVAVEGIGCITAHRTLLNGRNQVHACHVLRQRRYQHRYEKATAHLQSPETQYGASIGLTLSAAIRTASEGRDCVDNLRWARKDNAPDRRRYRKAKARGCCGFHDDQITIDGKVYFYGFNYGH